MKTTKIQFYSVILNRQFHLDLFEPSGTPELLVVMFGGSGMTREKYARYAGGVNELVQAAAEEVMDEGQLALAYAYAPFDVRMNAFEEEPDEAERWRGHVLQEILPQLPDVPLYCIGYSGGMALAAHSLLDHRRCFSGGGLGADQLPADFQCRPEWREPLALYYNLEDRVFDANLDTVQKLEAKGVARCFRQLPGGHDLADYAGNGSLPGLLRRACRLMERN